MSRKKAKLLQISQKIYTCECCQLTLFTGVKNTAATLSVLNVPSTWHKKDLR